MVSIYIYICVCVCVCVCVRVKNHPNITLVLNYLEVSGNRLPSLYDDSLKGKRKRKRKKSSLISCRFCISTQFWNLKQQSLWFIIVANKVRQIPFQSNGQIYVEFEVFSVSSHISIGREPWGCVRWDSNKISTFARHIFCHSFSSKSQLAPLSRIGTCKLWCAKYPEI